MPTPIAYFEGVLLPIPFLSLAEDTSKQVVGDKGGAANVESADQEPADKAAIDMDTEQPITDARPPMEPEPADQELADKAPTEQPITDAMDMEPEPADKDFADKAAIDTEPADQGLADKAAIVTASPIDGPPTNKDQDVVSAPVRSKSASSSGDFFFDWDALPDSQETVFKRRAE